jgi:hypothetical protein
MKASLLSPTDPRDMDAVPCGDPDVVLSST